MKFTVDQNLCIGCEACEGIAPEVFEFPDDTSRVKIDPVPAALQESALRAEKNCPVEAISHEP